MQENDYELKRAVPKRTQAGVFKVTDAKIKVIGTFSGVGVPINGLRSTSINSSFQK